MDILLIDNSDGGDIRFIGGDVATEEGLYSSIYLSLFSGNCWAKVYDNDVNTNRDFIESLNLPITKDNLGKMKAQAELALEWLINDKIAQKVEIDVSSPEFNRVRFDITVNQEKQENVFSLVWDKEKQNVARFIDLSRGGY